MTVLSILLGLIVVAWLVFIAIYDQDAETLEFTVRDWVRNVARWVP